MENWFRREFWDGITEKVVDWAVTSIPPVLLILLLTIIALRVLALMMKKTRAVMIARLKKNRNVVDTTELEKRVETLVLVAGSAARVTVWVMTGMIILREIGLDIGPLLAGAGIAGLAIGFGGQELVRDVISGFFILLENQIRTGDVAIINGTGGLVETIGLRTTVMRDLSGTVHVFQNGKISSLSNMTKDWSGMVFDVGVAYKEDTDRVVEVMKRVASELREDDAYKEKIIDDLEVFGVDSFGDSAVVVKARFKTKPIQQWAVGREYRRRLKKAFDGEGIEIPFPHRTIYWGAEIDPLKLDRNKGDE